MMSSLTELDLNGNSVASWSQVENLAHLPSLLHLRLNGNQLTDISPGPGSFPHLRSLQLCDNNISNWTSLGNLDTLVSLLDLRFRGNPLNSSEKDEDTVRQLVVARLSHITNLNGSSISSTERKWAEIDYLKKYGAEYLSLSTIPDPALRSEATQKFLTQHNRYDKMVTKYGDPDPGDGQEVDTSLKSSLIRLSVRTPQVIGSAVTVKKVPAGMSVAKLRALLHRLVKKSSGGAPIIISLISKDQEFLLDNDLRDISFYSVSDGDSVVVKWPDVTHL